MYCTAPTPTKKDTKTKNQKIKGPLLLRMFPLGSPFEWREREREEESKERKESGGEKKWRGRGREVRRGER